MMIAKGADYLVRATGAAALVIGLLLWSGRLYELVGVHMAFGVAVVLGLLALAVGALVKGVARPAATLAVAWALATLALGLAQTRIVAGDGHVVVRIAHLLLGLGAVALGATLARAVRAAPAGAIGS